MANWVCKQDGVQFPPGLPCCPECQTRDAFELGGDQSLNVYDAVEVTGIARPDEAWATVNETVAEGLHAVRQDGGETVTADEARAQLMVMRGDAEVEKLTQLVEEAKRNPAPISDTEVAERLGDVDVTYREPDRSLGLPDDGNPVQDDDRASTSGEPGSLEGTGESADSGTKPATAAEDTPAPRKATTRSKAGQKDVSS